jgi:hypothetical protein
LIVLVVVVALALPARKAIDDDHDNGKTREFLIVLVVVVVLALPVRKAIDDENDNEHDCRRSLTLPGTSLYLDLGKNLTLLVYFLFCSDLQRLSMEVLSEDDLVCSLTFP